MVQRTLMLAAQIFTVRDLILKNTPEDYRVAYLLLDSAAELLMVRRTDYELAHYMYDDAIWKKLSIPINLDDPEQQEREKAAASGEHVWWLMSKTQRRTIEREFMSKAKYLAWSEGKISPSLIAVMKRLHEYRNEIYHNDIVRFEALSSMVKLYTLVIAELLRGLRPDSIAMWGDVIDELRSIFERAGVPVPSRLAEHTVVLVGPGIDLFGLQSMMADELVKALGDDTNTVGESLALYVEGRLLQVHELLDFCGNHVFSGEVYSNLDVVRFLYREKATPWSLELLRAQSPRYTKKQFESWDQLPGRLRAADGPLDAFVILTEFETQFEDLEQKIDGLADSIEAHVSGLMDQARGK